MSTSALASVRPRLPQRFLPVVATVVVFAVTFGIGSVRYQDFASGQVVANLFIDNAFLIVLAVGMTFVILTGGIDLSVGAVAALSTMIAAATLRAGWPVLLSVLAVLVSGTVLGLLMGLVIHYFDVQPFIVTLAGMFLARGLCFLISVESVSITDTSFRDFATGTVVLPGDVTVTYSVFVALAVVAAAVYVLHLTRFGRTVYAVGGNETSARLMGLPTTRAKVGVYAVSGFAPPWAACCSRCTCSPATGCTRSAWSWTPSPPWSSAAPCWPAGPAMSPVPRRASWSSAPYRR